MNRDPKRRGPRVRAVATEVLSVRVPVPILANLDAMAEEQGIRRSALVIRALDEFIDREKTKRYRRAP